MGAPCFDEVVTPSAAGTILAADLGHRGPS